DVVANAHEVVEHDDGEHPTEEYAHGDQQEVEARLPDGFAYCGPELRPHVRRQVPLRRTPLRRGHGGKEATELQFTDWL
ncbi:hypothetical protein OFN34_35115, partial [Escherichia coli]|nr:hypothetical protein [Escherichia coli]